MTLRLIIHEQDIAPLLVSAPVIRDELDSVCRTLEFSMQQTDGLVTFLGESVQLYLGDERWFFGYLETRDWESQGHISCKAYDPLYFLKKNASDYYFKGVTADQRAREVCEHAGVPIGLLEPTGYVLPPRPYLKAEGDKIIIDSLARTFQANGRKFWFRFNPEDGAGFGVSLFERVVPDQLWAFQRGVNLLSARYGESLEEHYNIVRLVNRESGKVVVRYDEQAIADYGARVFFEEVNQDTSATMDQDASNYLKEKRKLKTTVSLEGLNPNLSMPSFYSGDVIFIEERVTDTYGAYHIRNVTQTVLNSNSVQLAFDVQDALDVPPVQFEDAQQPEPAAGIPVQDKPKNGPVVYSPELQRLIDQYGLDHSKRGAS